MLETVGRYKVQEKIGEGAMADVYRAYDPSINRALAIKVLKNEFLQDEEYAARFLREAKAAGALSHPNIVTIFDVGEVSGHPFIVMELLDGKPLDQAMAEKRIGTVDEIVNIGMQLARALDYAHAQGIIHRDIKPSNIMLSQDGQSVKILDYGIARLNETDALLGQEVLKTQVGAVLGTPRYMSPEQALGQTSDGRSDLYSVGIVLYELLTGKKAFSSGSMATLMLQITQQDPEPINKISPDVPGGLVFIVNKLLAKKPEKRFQKGAELYAALKREMASMEAQKAEKTKPRAMSLPIKVTLIATAFVLSLLGLSIWAALNKQNRVMEQMSVTSGSAISGFVANNIGTNMAIQDWDQVSVFVKVASEDKNVDDMVVVDNNGIIRGAKDAKLEGTRYRPKTGPILSNTNGITVIETKNGIGNRVFQFSQPVTYSGEIKGRVHVGLKQNALEAAASLSRNVLLGLGLMTLLSVIAVAYSIASVLSRPMRRLKEAFTDASKGNLDFRISHKRKDEFGELFDGFNNMVSAVQSRVDTAEGFTGDIASSPGLKTGLNLTGIAAGGAILGAEALKSSPFSKPVDTRPEDPAAKEEAADTAPHEEIGTPQQAASDEAEHAGIEDLDANLTDVAVDEAANASASDVAEHPPIKVDDDVSHSAFESPQPDVSEPVENSYVETAHADTPELADNDSIEQAIVHQVDPVTPSTHTTPAAADRSASSPEQSEEAAAEDQDILNDRTINRMIGTPAVEADPDAATDTAMNDNIANPSNHMKDDMPSSEAPPVLTDDMPGSLVADDADHDRTIVRSPNMKLSGTRLPVNPLARKSGDEGNQTSETSDDVLDEDLDRTIVRPPTR